MARNASTPLGAHVVAVSLAVGLGACASGGAKARLESADYARRFEDSRKKSEDLEYPGLLSKLGIETAKDEALPFDPTQARYFAEVSKALGLTDAEKVPFQRNGFVMVDHSKWMSMGGAYLEIYKADLPVFVSADSILHALHRSYDAVLMDLEWGVMIPNLEAVLALIEGELCPFFEQQDLRDSVSDLALFTTVARNLLAGVKADAKAEPRLPPACGAIPGLAGVLEEIGRESLSETRLYGSSRIVDWSQFRPRGHYTRDPRFAAYFRTMMWMGRADLAWSLDVDRELRDAALLVLLAKKSGQSKPLAAMGRVLDFMVGRADSTGLAEMQAALDLAKIDQPTELAAPDAMARLRGAMNKVPMTSQQIRSAWLGTDQHSSKETPLPSAFQLMGQRFVVDAFVLSKVVYDSILFHKSKQDRRMPTGLDVAASLGSNEAIIELEPQIRQYNYAANLLAARQLIDGLPATERQSNAYIRWLDALRQLFARPESDHFPHVMRSREWGRKQLQTTLASWAELRHDTVLYAKQSYSGSIICEFPEGYVEPYPAFFEALKDLARETKVVLGDTDLYPQSHKGSVQQEQRRRSADFFDRFAEIMGQLQGIAVKELRAQPLDAKERQMLKDVVVEHKGFAGCGAGRPTYYTGWYADLYYDGEVTQPLPTVADVHTDPDAGLVLEEGVGNPRYLVIAIDNQQDRAVYVGPAYSYYELTSQVRLTDEEWGEKVATTPPPPPSFTTGFLVAPSKRSVASPPKPAPPPNPSQPAPATAPSSGPRKP